jgi:DNA polymerase III sliding clamp (beta) subunit (PCNA family)
MKVKELAELLKKAGPTSKKPPQPYMKNVVILHDGYNVTGIRATNFAVAYKYGDGENEMYVNHAKLEKVVRSRPYKDGEVYVEDGYLVIKSHSRKTSLLADTYAEASGYPKPFQPFDPPRWKVCVDAEQLKKATGALIASVADEKANRPVLTCFFISPVEGGHTPDEFRLYASNGFALSHISIPAVTNGGTGETAIVPSKEMKAVATQLDGEVQIEFYGNGHELVMSSGQHQYVIATEDAAMPSIDEYIRPTGDAPHIEVKIRDFNDALSAVRIAAEESAPKGFATWFEIQWGENGKATIKGESLPEFNHGGAVTQEATLNTGAVHGEWTGRYNFAYLRNALQKTEPLIEPDAVITFGISPHVERMCQIRYTGAEAEVIISLMGMLFNEDNGAVKPPHPIVQEETK